LELADNNKFKREALSRAA